MYVSKNRFIGAALVVVGVGVGLVWLSGFGGSDEARTELMRARETFTAGRFDEAYEHYREVTLLAPNTEMEARARYEMASIAYLRWRDHNEARTYLRALVRETPRSEVIIDAKLLLARIHYEAMNQHRRALREYRMIANEFAGELSADQLAETRLGIARIEEQFGKSTAARAIYEQVWRAERVDARYHAEAVDALVRLASRREDLGRMRELLREEIARATSLESRLELTCQLIDAELSTNAYDGAEATLRLAQASFPGELRIQKRRDHLSQLMGGRPRVVSAVELKRLQDGIPWSVRRRRERPRPVPTEP